MRESGLTFAELPGVCWAAHLAWPALSTLLPEAGLRRLGFDEAYWNERASYRLSDEGAWGLGLGLG